MPNCAILQRSFAKGTKVQSGIAEALVKVGFGTRKDDVVFIALLVSFYDPGFLVSGPLPSRAPRSHVPDNMFVFQTFHGAEAVFFRCKFHCWSFMGELLPSEVLDGFSALC